MTGHGKTGKKWVTAIAAAHKTLRTTGSLTAAKKSLKSQALYKESVGTKRAREISIERVKL